MAQSLWMTARRSDRTPCCAARCTSDPTQRSSNTLRSRMLFRWAIRRKSAAKSKRRDRAVHEQAAPRFLRDTATWGSWINLGAAPATGSQKHLRHRQHGVSLRQSRHRHAVLGLCHGRLRKTAINTGIFTGKVIGVCSMMYGFVTSNVPSFVNYARLFGQMTTLPPDIMAASQLRMFSRRKVSSALRHPTDARHVSVDPGRTRPLRRSNRVLSRDCVDSVSLAYSLLSDRPTECHRRI